VGDNERELEVFVLIYLDVFYSVIINANAPHIKMVSEQFDRCHGTLLQYVEFLNSSVSPVSAYAQLIPSLGDLVHKYHIEPEVCLPEEQLGLIFQLIYVLVEFKIDARHLFSIFLSRSF
jgi:hypothetical protein